MSVTNAIERQLDFNLRYARQLVGDVPNDLIAHVPGSGLVSHPAFTIGHLVAAAAMVVEDMGGQPNLPEGWNELFGRKGPDDQTRASENVALYPSAETLLDELARQHERIKNHLRSVSETELEKVVQWRFAAFMPSLLDLVLFFCINHEAMHLGQLAAWRRAMNMPPALQQL